MATHHQFSSFHLLHSCYPGYSLNDLRNLHKWQVQERQLTHVSNFHRKLKSFLKLDIFKADHGRECNNHGSEIVVNETKYDDPGMQIR